jgi:hypothetical protein
MKSKDTLRGPRKGTHAGKWSDLPTNEQEEAVRKYPAHAAELAIHFLGK